MPTYCYTYSFQPLEEQTGKRSSFFYQTTHFTNMYQFILLLLLSLSIFGQKLQAQSEINFNVRFNTQQIQTADPAIFETLERDIVTFLNGQAWTKDAFTTEERINCNLIFTLKETESPNNYELDLAIQSSRPVFGSGGETALFNYLDNKIGFYYEQFQAVQLSENSFTGNLPAVLGFYAYLILGFDYDSFSPLGGQVYFEKAQEIFNRLPSNLSSDDSGWRPAGTRNRYWLLENILSPRMLPLRRANYNYHLRGLDMMHKNPDLARIAMMEALEDVQLANQAYPNAPIIQVFNDAKREEIIEIFKAGTLPEQNTVIQIFSRVDPANAGKYRAIRNRATPGARAASPAANPRKSR